MTYSVAFPVSLLIVAEGTAELPLTTHSSLQILDSTVVKGGLLLRYLSHWFWLEHDLNDFVSIGLF